MNFPRKTIFLIFFISLLFLTTGYTKDTKYKHKNKRAPEVARKKQDPKENKVIKDSSPLTVNLDLTSNYIFRGITQTKNAPAIQGGLTYTVPHVGIYGYVWGSNVNFPDINNDRATTEVAFAIGIANTIKKFQYNLSYVEYNYPHTIGLTYNEFLASAQWSFVTALLGYSRDVFASGQPGTYYNLGLNYDIPAHYIFDLNDMNISGGIGYYSMPISVGLLSYADYGIQLTKTIKNYQLALGWTDTNGNSNDEPQFKNSKLIFTISATFP